MRNKMLWIVGLVAGACAISSTGVDLLAAPKVKTREAVNLMRTDRYGTLPETGDGVPEDLKVFPVTSDRGNVVSNATGGIAGTDEQLLYSNPLGNFAVEISSNILLADDIKLAVQTGCPLTRYTVQVIGKANPNACGGAGISCGPVRIDFELFNECPGAGGVPIDGTAGCVTNDPGNNPDCMLMPSEFEVTEVEFVVPAIDTVSLPSTVWLGVRANRGSTGVVVGTPAQRGFSGDVFDTLGFPCNASAGGFPAQPHSSFNAQIWGDGDCPDTCLIYQNIRSGQSGINAGANNCIADDLELDTTCNLVEMEVGVRGSGFYDIELRRDIGGFPEGGCAGGASSMNTFNIDGTFKRFLVTNSGLNVRRFQFDPPIQIQTTKLFAVLVPNNINATWILTGRNASIGNTTAGFRKWTGDTWETEFPVTNAHGAFQITLTCAGACPIGACCDQFVRDENNDAICRDLPKINCPFPPKDSQLKPAWAADVSCNACSGGLRDGLPCQSDTDCEASACVGGLNDGFPCTTDEQCSFCEDQTPCTTNADCLGIGDELCRLAECTGGTCMDNDPFLLPCGDAACCQPDGDCNNITLNECNLLLPLDAPRLWELGQFCNTGGQRCPLPACIDAEGDCLTANPRLCDGGVNDGESCRLDSDCPSSNDGECVDQVPQCLGGVNDAQECDNDLDCIPGGFCVSSVCSGGARDGERCEGFRDCRESICNFQPGCRDPFCCDAVCRLAPGLPLNTEFCCEVHWDGQCAELAQREDVEDCDEAPGNDRCAPTERTSGAVEILVDGLLGRTNSVKATIDSSDGFCCNEGISRCDGGCPDPDLQGALAKACDDDNDCAGADDGYCNFPPDFSSPGTCTDGCNSQEQCVNADTNVLETICIGGPNGGLPCKPRCVGGTRAGLPCGNVGDCPEGTACDGAADCGEGNICDNTFCEGADDGFCADPVPEPGGRGVASVWYYFTVPENGLDDTLSVEVSTCESTTPATDSLLQVFSTGDSDTGVCDDNLGICDDGTFCDRVLDDCSDGSTCAATEQPCNVSAQDCPIATSSCLLDVGEACRSLSVIGCSDDAGAEACGGSSLGKLSKLCLSDLQRGETYFIVVSAKTEDAKGEYRVRVSTVTSCDEPTGGNCVDLICDGGVLNGEPCLADEDCALPPQPVNDFCPGELEFPAVVGQSVVPFTLDGATFDCRDEPCNTNLQNDIWYTWTAPEAGSVSFKTCGDGDGPPPDTEMMIYFGCGCPPPRLPDGPNCYSASTDPACIPSASTTAPLEVEAGDCLTIRLGDNSGTGGDGEMTITYEPVPACSSGAIFADNPANGTIDARWDTACVGDTVGLDTFTIFGPTESAALECWTLCESGTELPEGTVLPPNDILSVEETSPGLYTVTLQRPITPGHCTSILYNEQSGAPSVATYASLPGDVDASRASNATDTLLLVDVLNGVSSAPAGELSTDVDHTGVTNATDVLAVIDALNGAGTCEVWNNVALPADCGTCPPLP